MSDGANPPLDQIPTQPNFLAAAAATKRAAKPADFKSPDANPGKSQNETTVPAGISQLVSQREQQSSAESLPVPMPSQPLAEGGSAGMHDSPGHIKDRLPDNQNALTVPRSEAASAKVLVTELTSGWPQSRLPDYQPLRTKASDSSAPEAKSAAANLKTDDQRQPSVSRQFRAATSVLASKLAAPDLLQSTLLPTHSEAGAKSSSSQTLVANAEPRYSTPKAIDSKNAGIESADVVPGIAPSNLKSAPIASAAGTRVNPKGVDPKTVDLNPAYQNNPAPKNVESTETPGSSILRTSTTLANEISASIGALSSSANPPAEVQGRLPLYTSQNGARSDAGQPAALATFIAGSLGTPDADSKPKPGSAPLALSDPSRHSPSDDNRAAAPEKSEGDEAAAPLFAPVTVTLPLTPNGAAGPINSPALASGLAPSSSRIGEAAQARLKSEPAGTPKSAEAPASTKLQSRQEIPAHSADSSTAGQSGVSAPPKAADSSPNSSAAASQLTSPAGESKNGNTSLFPAAADPQTSLEHESAGFAPNHAQPEIPAAYPTSLINSAKLVERIGAAELRLGMRAGEFGNVDIRTSMVRNQFTAEISVERGELGRVMAAELPGLQTRLAEQRVPVANISLQNHSGSQSNASEQQKPRDPQQVYVTNSVTRLDEDRIPPLAGLEGPSAPSSRRLDIHM